MTLFDQIDLMARGGSISLLALWSWILLRDHGGVLAARLAVAMNAAICCYIVVTIGWYQRPLIIGLVFALGAGSTPGLFWLFTKSWFNDEQRFRPRDLALVGASVANTAVVQLTFPEDGWINTASGVIFRVAMLAFAGAALIEMWRGREGDLIEGRRKLRTRMVFVVGIYVILIALTEVAAHNGWISHQRQHVMGSLAVLVILAFCAAMFRMRQSDLFAVPVDQGRRSVPATIDDPLADKLLEYMKREMPHRDETLSIAKLAAQLGEQEYRLRRTINRQMGHRNFSSFLNGYRLAEVKAALSDASQREVPIITIALDAGFGSLGPFNRAFREAEGMTPSEFRARFAG
ncbi:MAG: helix-turn-helix transcriptional regulator [Sphingomonadaceae bacterium]|nr:helix-turn-helix transcriptional regulator [Sphingomonadaceae bacterium]